jgi:hypothetical protein
VRACVCPCAFARVRPSVNTVNVEPGEKAKAGGRAGKLADIAGCFGCFGVFQRKTPNVFFQPIVTLVSCLETVSKLIRKCGYCGISTKALTQQALSSTKPRRLL